MDVNKYNGQMQSLAYGEAFMAAAEDYKKVRVVVSRLWFTPCRIRTSTFGYVLDSFHIIIA